MYKRKLLTEEDVRLALSDVEGLGVEACAKWTAHKWCLVVSVASVFVCGAVGLTLSVLTWFAAYPAAPVLLVTDRPLIVVLTFASSLLLLASILGFTGALLNARPILAVYALLLLPSFIAGVSAGYIAYHKLAYSLDRKLSQAWNDERYDAASRLLIQSALQCCGWVSPLHSSHAAAPSGTCYPLSALPGCRAPLAAFERGALGAVCRAVFALFVPLHLANVFAALLCANHVSRRFGKGVTPARYRLTRDDVAEILRSRGATHGVDKGGGEGEGGVGGEPGLSRPPPIPSRNVRFGCVRVRVDGRRTHWNAKGARYGALTSDPEEEEEQEQ